MRIGPILVTLAALTFAPAAFAVTASTLPAAGDPSSTDPTAPATGASGAGTMASNDPVICHRMEETGTRLGARQICLRKSQWEQRQMEDRANLDKAQTLTPSARGQ